MAIIFSVLLPKCKNPFAHEMNIAEFKFFDRNRFKPKLELEKPHFGPQIGGPAKTLTRLDPTRKLSARSRLEPSKERLVPIPSLG